MRRAVHKRNLHPAVGLPKLRSEEMPTADRGQRPVIHTAGPGSESYERLRLPRAVGPQETRVSGQADGIDGDDLRRAAHDGAGAGRGDGSPGAGTVGRGREPWAQGGLMRPAAPGARLRCPARATGRWRPCT